LKETKKIAAKAIKIESEDENDMSVNSDRANQEKVGCIV
jgi:hypothetical protein